MKKPDFDLEAAHRYFAAYCFNAAWDLIDKPARTPEEDEQMIRLSLASAWHWTQRPDCTPTNMSIGYWQAARVYALVGQAANAKRYALLCQEISQGIEPFYLAYANEALARAESIAGNLEQAQSHVAEARKLAARSSEEEEAIKQLLADLDTLS